MDLHDFDATTLYFDDPCSPLVVGLLDEAAEAYAAGEAELPLLKAYFNAPDQLMVLVALYRCYFYMHRLADADLVAYRAMDVAGQRLGLPIEWHEVDEAALGLAAARSMGLLRFWLMALKARAILAMRDGRLGTGREMLDKLLQLDEHDRMGARPLLAVLDRVDSEHGETHSPTPLEAV